MKTFVLAGTIALSLVSVEAIAACPGPSPSLNATQITALLKGNTICVPAVTVPTMTWQELHQADWSLVDYKRGPGHAIDPSEVVGSWSVTGTGSDRTVTHNYGSGGTYTYLIYGSGNVGDVHSFCPVGGGTEILGRVKSGGGAC